MKKHFHAIQVLRQRLSELTAIKREEWEKIRRLKNEPGTGVVRSRLHNDYNDLFRPRARAIHLANGLLRGVPYLAMEVRCWRKPPLYRVYEAIQEAFGEDKDLRAEWTLERVQGLLERITEVQGAAA